MTSDLITDISQRNPRVSVRVCDFAVQSINLSPEDTSPDALEEYTRVIQEVLTQALTRHAAEQMEAFEAQLSLPADPERDRALAKAHELVEKARAQRLPPIAQRQWFPDQADGRDASGRVHASVRGNEVVILEIPYETWEDVRVTERAIREAVNLAISRLSSDVMRFAAKVDSDDS